MSPLDLLPVSWRVDAMAIGLVAGIAGLAGAGLYLHHQWYGDGYAVAAADAQKKMDAIEAANRAAVDGANKALLETADTLAKKNMELDDALAQIDAAAGGVDGDAVGLDERRVRVLGGIR